MKHNSLIFKTHLIGALSALLLVAFAIFLTIFAIFFDKRQEIRHIVSLQKEIKANPSALAHTIKAYHLQAIDITSALKVKREGKHILNDPLIREIFTLSKMAVYTYEGHYYYELRDNTRIFWLKSTYRVSNYILYIVGASLLLITLLLWLHLYIQSSLKPLKALHTQIMDYGQSKKLTPLVFKNNDEISTLAHAFYDSVEQLHQMQQSRTALIETFMHEIKSTLTKLILRTHLLREDSQHKQPLLEGMDKMQSQLSQVNAYNAVMMEMLEFDVQTYYLNSVLDEVLYELKSDLHYNSEINPILEIDNKLFATALKALLPFATNIKIEKRALSIESGLIEDDNKINLDYSIAKTILEKHGFTLEFSYSSALQTFKINF